MSHSTSYADPYSNANYSYRNSYPQTSNNNDSYAQSINTPTTAGQYSNQPYASTDKMVEPPPSQYQTGTERAQKGRQGVGGGTAKSWGTTGPPPRSTGILRMWRKDERGKQWTRGGGCRVFLRMFFCCFSISLIIVICVILSILLYIRPPSVALNDITIPSNPVTLSGTGLSVNFGIDLSVSNPNWFSVNFEQIKATISYPGVSSGPLGGGTLNNANFAGHTATTLEFPLSFNYSLSADPNRVIINDLANKCGVTSQDITINYALDTRIRVLGILVKPAYSSSASFECPITSDQIKSIIGDVAGG